MVNPFNNLILVPELVIEKVITQALIFLRKDYVDQMAEYNDESKTYLYLLTNGVGVQRVDFFKQAKKIFLAEPDDPKRINVYLQFPQKIDGSVAICITHSGEQHGENVLSVGESSSFIEETIPVNDIDVDVYRKTYSRRYNSTYQIICTADNPNEAIILYTILKALFISLEGTSHWNAMGFKNCKIGGGDIQIKAEVTKPLFAKAISFSFGYEFSVPDVRRQEFINGAIFNALLKLE